MKKTSILLIEDDAPLRASLEDFLTAMGYSVTGFSAGQPALEHIQNSDQFDKDNTLVLIDVHLGQENGLDIQESLRQSGSTLPFVFMSSNQDGHNVNRAWRGGALNFILKPFSSGELHAVIAQAMQSMNPSNRPGAKPAVDPNLSRRFGQLSPRQKDVFKMVASGMSNSAIAERLAISARTVKMHREAVMYRLDCNHVTDLVRCHDALKELL